ncbi:hypothetical protein Y1Q_0004217 [Alligator mississippiensis]|uniref:FRAS1-related extracellular matrix protein N-terminal domain-containing protein n=2 Tax=Alligator mississippiensis TaxID=8496 RepID=A0A151M7H8_ALLMI|nr:hypothetical protein Y1Q_0004217 [Alligator mississippiensis]
MRVLPLALHVEVLFQQLRLLARNLPLPVAQLRGLSPPLDARVLGFADGLQACRLTALPLPLPGASLPAHGRLVDAAGRPLPPGYTRDCDAFLQEGVRYQHTAPAGSPDRDYVPMRVDALPAGAAGPGEREYFQVVVRVREGAENKPPRPSSAALLVMEVDQFVLAALTPEALAAEDLETPADLLLFNLTSGGGADPHQHGYLLSTDDPGRPLTTFTQREVRELKIAYQPPTVDSDRERLFQLEMEVLDPEGASSEPFAFVVVVKPMNTLAPLATLNRALGPQLMLFEGQSRPLAGSLEISDEDNLDEVKVWVVRGLRHGELK